MNLLCEHIQKVVDISKQHGVDVLEVSDGWTKIKQVVHMKSGLTSELKKEIEEQQLCLRYWSSPKTPHNAGDEGFTCDACKVGITFPQ
ncbi:hypothetical protein C3B51_13240 [Pseudoalteromonas rubra]|uniref:Uncharacterized protein n=1 Tax=Pseudoalteromonas rubra TaxID=43658 RepID=A0A4Q7EC05_9GAMM|nr:hypothetical protein [Pseudoalteromonas rubra]RZM80135.1 hypothetical protein C3B51_13240 [Pseudoalteromonas rubra]